MPCPVLALITRTSVPSAIRSISVVLTLISTPAFAKRARNAPEFPLLRDHARRHCASALAFVPQRLKIRTPSPPLKSFASLHWKILPQHSPLCGDAFNSHNTRLPLAPSQNNNTSFLGFRKREGESR